MSDTRTDDEMLEGETRKVPLSDADPNAGEADLDALTTELETRALAEEELDELTMIPSETGAATKTGAGRSEDASTKRKVALEKAQELVGKVISDRYEVEEVLAAGGMGCVYRGRHTHMHKRVAIKVLLPETEGLAELVLRFKREAVAGAHIDHPNVAAATDFGKLEDGSFFLVQQYVRGSTLYDLIKRGPMPAARAAQIARQVASALDACHRIGIVHRDLKPRNIMVEEDRGDAVKLIDFGLARVPMDRISTIDVKDVKEARKNLKVTKMGTIMGTVGYMAPEALGGMDEVGELSDLYALGIILYEMLAGAHPFGGGKPAEVFRKHRSMRPPPIQEKTPGVVVPAALEAVAMRLLEKDPKARYATARDVIAALDEAVPGMATTAERQPISSVRGPSDGGGTAPKSAEVRLAAASAGADAPKAAAEVGGYTPRLVGRVATHKKTDWASLRRWVIPSVIVVGVVAIAIVGLVFFRGGQKNDGPRGSIATASASQAPSGPASAATQDSADTQAEEKAVATRKLMRSATEAKEWSRGADALVTLAEISPRSFEDKVVAADTIAIAVAIDVGSGDKADKVFDALATKVGDRGLDLLYEIVSTRGGSKASARAADILRRKDVIERASPALRIAVDLRDAGSCQEKLALLDRAKKDGDERAVAVLDNMRRLPCVAGSGECCFKTNGAVADAVTQIWTRVRSSK